MSILQLILFLQLGGLPAAQEAAANRFRDASGDPLPVQTDSAIERFLSRAQVLDLVRLGEGVSGARKATLQSDSIRLQAIFRDIRLETPGRTRPSGERVTLRDDCIFEVAAYRLDRLLGIGRIPPVVERTIAGRAGTLQLWIENAVTEKGRRTRGLSTTPAMEDAWQEMLLFDNLIFNDDRNRGNVVYDSDGRLWMIDHTRAFRRYPELPYPEAVERCRQDLWRRLTTLPDSALVDVLKPYLKPPEIEALLARRQLIVEHIRGLIAEKGSEAVLY